MSYDYSENAGTLLRDELGWDVQYAYNTETLGKDSRINMLKMSRVR